MGLKSERYLLDSFKTLILRGKKRGGARRERKIPKQQEKKIFLSHLVSLHSILQIIFFSRRRKRTFCQGKSSHHVFALCDLDSNFAYESNSVHVGGMGKEAYIKGRPPPYLHFCGLHLCAEGPRTKAEIPSFYH